jgi:hypothetical protein
MARIPTYEKDLLISDVDRLIGTDGNTNELTTKNFFLADIANYIIDKLIDPDASSFQIPLFREATDTIGADANRITGSIISQDLYPEGTKISIAGKLQVDAEALIKGKLSQGVATSGKLILNSSLNATGITIVAPAHADLAASYSMELPADMGTAGAQLTTDGVGKVYWADAEDDDLNFSGDLGTGTVDLDTQVLSIVGGENIDTVANGQTLTINATNFITGEGAAFNLALFSDTKEIGNSLISQSSQSATASITVDAERTLIGKGNSSSYNQTVIGRNINALSDTIINGSTDVALGYGSSSGNRYRNVAIASRQLKIGKDDDTSSAGTNTTGFINFNNSAEGNRAFVNIGGIVGYFPPPTATNVNYFISAFSENVESSVFQGGAAPTASRYNMGADPNLSCMGEKYDANTTIGGAMYVTASNNSPTPSSRGIVTFDCRHQNLSANAPDGHKLFEITSGYGATKFVLKQVDGGTNIGINEPSPEESLHVSGNIKLDETAATTDTDKFVVLDSGVLKYRTGDEVRSDIGASNFSGDYNDLTNKPTIPTNNNELTNGAGYTTNTGTVDGTGTANTLAMWSDSDTLTDSSITEGAGGVMIADDVKVMGDMTIGEVGTPGDLKLPTAGSNIDVGVNTITGSDNSIALGSGNTVNAAYSIATGQNNTITANESIAAGFGNTASGTQSQAFGFGTAASGAQAIAFGNGATASGARALAGGFNTTASGLNSVAFGNNTTASGPNSFASGSNTTAAGFGSAAIGNNLNVTSSACLGAGLWNADAGNYKFQVGAGTSDAARINALSVTTTGKILMHVLRNSTSYSNDAQAAAGGVQLGELYRHGNVVQIRIE